MRRRFLAFVVLGGSVGPGTLGAAETAQAASEFLRAIAEAPALTAAARRTSAARERVGAAGRLADPEVEGMTSRMNGPMGDRSTMFELNLRQPLPKRGERVADREQAQAGVAMAAAEFSRVAGDLAADTANALAEAEGAQRRIGLLETQIGRLEAVLRSVEIRLSTAATARIADRLTLQTRIAAMQFGIEEERVLASDALAEARGRLGLGPDATLPPFAAPTVASIDPDDTAALRFALAQADEASAGARRARASASPLTAVGLRLERERTERGDEDTVGLAFSSEIPWRGRGYARAEARAAEAERAAAQSDATAARARISSALTRVERAQRLAASGRRLSGETVARLNAEYDALIRSASVGSGAGESTVLQTVEILEKVTETEVQIIRAETALHAALAELWRYAPAAHFSDPTL